jgi:hypothetical protein
MTSPKKFKDVVDGDLGATLLQAARQEQHAERALQRTLLALTAAASASALGSAGLAKAASAGVSGVVKSAQVAAAPGAAGAVSGLGISGLGKSAALLTVAKWFCVTAIAGGAALGSARWWEAAHPAALPVRAVSSNAVSSNAVSSSAVPSRGGEGLEAVVAQSPVAERSVSSPLAVNSAARASANSKRAQPSPAFEPNAGSEPGAGLDTGPSGSVMGERSATPNVAVASAPVASVAVASVAVASVPGPSPTFSPPSAEALAPDVHELQARVSAPRTANLAVEVRSLDAARARLSAGDARGALRLLVQHRKQFGTGSFGPEALFLRMRAEQALGDGAAARRTARQILEQFPSGPSAESARQLLGE